MGYYPLNTLAADGNGDGVVDVQDLALVQANFGRSNSAGRAEFRPRALRLAVGRRHVRNWLPSESRLSRNPHSISVTPAAVAAVPHVEPRTYG